jgi:hypothetical protein
MGFAGNAMLYHRGDERDGRASFAPPADRHDHEAGQRGGVPAQSDCVS